MNLFIFDKIIHFLFRMTQILEDIEAVLNDNIDRKLIMDLLSDWDILTMLAKKINAGGTKGRTMWGAVPQYR